MHEHFISKIHYFFNGYFQFLSYNEFISRALDSLVQESNRYSLLDTRFSVLDNSIAMRSNLGYRVSSIQDQASATISKSCTLKTSKITGRYDATERLPLLDNNSGDSIYKDLKRHSLSTDSLESSKEKSCAPVEKDRSKPAPLI
jgi:hypothetical protein